jgi:predicted nucleic acid-binding Zn ribbon protein/NTP pyrophosphatase (non-canonical NTP hydrolase)
MRTRKNLACKICGKPIGKGFIQYCSNECKIKANEKQCVCLNCHKQFVSQKHRRYCSEDCRKQQAYKQGLHFHPGQVEVLLEKAFKCEYCGETFFDKINKDRKYCSNECQLLANKNNNKITGRPQTRFKKKKYCKLCGKEFETIAKNRRYCSRTCWYMSDECRNKVSSNPTKYNGITFRSSWEAIVAEQLDKALFKYEYEQYKFYLDGLSSYYIPDFYIPEKDVFIEVKGQWLYDARQKVTEFRRQYPDKKLYVIESMDNFSMMMMLQYLYGLSHYEFNSTDENYLENKIKYTCMLMVDEIIEVLRETNYKEHKERKPVDKQKLVEEITDVFIFTMNMLHLLKIDAKSFIHTFKQKYTLNRFRQIFPKNKFKSISSFTSDFHIDSFLKK